MKTKVCIVGAGAIGGFIGTRLAAAGDCEVGAMARGATLAALRAHGWRMRQGERLVQGPLARASADARDLGPQDLVVIAVKGPALATVAEGIAPLLGPATVVLPAMNGVPWWFGEGVPTLGGTPLESVDPGGRIAASIPFERVVGCVVHASTSTPEPGLVLHKTGHGLVVGEPAGGVVSARVEALARLLADAGFDVTASADVRHAVWYKLWGNMTMNPVSAITGATIDRVLADPLVRGFCSQAMREAQAVGERIGLRIAEMPEDRHRVTAKLGAFKSSMLQDVEAARPLELDSLVAAVRELGRRVGVETPFVDALFGLARLFGRVHGLYPEACDVAAPADASEQRGGDARLGSCETTRHTRTWSENGEK